MTTYKRLLALTLTLTLLLGLLGQAAAENMTVYVGKDGASVYNAGGQEIGTVALDTQLTLTGMKDGICRVKLGGKTGYMKKSDLSATRSSIIEATPTPTPAPQAISMTVYAAKDGAKVYSKGGTLLGTLPANTQLTCTGVKDGVCRVTRGGKTGYMKKNDLSTSPVAVATPTPEVTPAPTEAPQAVAMTAYAAKDGAKVYNASGTAIGSLALNTQVTVTAVKDGVCRVTRGGKTGYMKKGDLSISPMAVAIPTPEITPSPTEAPQAVAMTAYAARDGAKVYNASGAAIGSLAVNTQVTVTAIKGSVCQVTRDGRTAYMKKGDLSTTKVETAPSAMCETAFVNKDGAKIYNKFGSVIGSVALNTQVTVTAMKGKVCQVSAMGKVAYMSADDLSCDKTEEKTEDKTEEKTNVVDIPDTTGYVNKDGAKVYNASGAVIATLSANTAVTVRAYNDALAEVSKGDVKGYMAKTDISASKLEAVANYTLKYGDTGDAVKKVQQRLMELGYFAGVIGGNYKALTQSAVQVFQAQAGLTVTGTCDTKTLEAMFSASAPAMPQTAELSAATSNGGTSSTSTVTPARGKAISMDWWSSDIQKIFARGVTATITDVATGLAWREQRRGGTNHADVQPLTAADTAVLKKAYGGKWSWNRRAIFVTINGVNYAASMNGMPHGGGSITGNNFNGHHCIHFTNSRTHGSNKVCSLHQAAIKKALSAKL